MKTRIALGLAVVLLLPAAWLLGTAGGLRAAAALGERLTGGALTIGSADGRLAGDVELRDFRYETATVTVAMDRAGLNLRLSRLLVGRLQAERLDVGELVVATRAPDPDPDPGQALTVRMPLRLAVEEGRVARFRLQRAGQEREWGLSEARFGARWRGEWIVIGALSARTEDLGALRLRGRLAIVEDRLEMAGLEIEGPATLRADGALALGADAHSALDVAWENLRPPFGPADFSSARGAARLDGPWSGYRWTLGAEVLARGIPATVDARGRGDLGSLAIERARVEALAGRIMGDGRLDWSQDLRTDLALDWTGIDPGAVWKEWPGRLNGNGRLQAHWRERPRIEFDADLRDSQMRGYAFDLRAVGRTEDGKVFLKTFALSSGASTLVASGQLLPELGLAAELRSTDLGSLWAGLSGRARLRGTARGTFAAPRVAARGTGDALAYGQFGAAHAELDARVAPAGRSEITLKLTGVAAGLPLQSLSLAADGTRGAHQLRAELAGAEGAATLVLEGGERAGAWRGRLMEARVTPPAAASAPAKEVWILEEPAALSYARGSFDLEPACLAAAASRACAEVTLGAGRQHLAFRARNFELRLLHPWLRSDWALSGAITGTASLRLAGGELTQLRADLTSTAGALEGGDVKLAFGPGELSVLPDEQRLHARFRLRPAGGEVEGDLWVAPGPALLDRPMLGDLRLRLPDLAWLPVLSPEIAAAQGAIEASLHVSGTPRSPSLDGQLEVSNGRVQLMTPGIELTDITASFERGRNAPLRLRAQARSGSGQFTVDGEFRSLQPRLAGEIAVRGENVLGVNRPDIRAWLSPDLKLALDGRSARLTGELGVPRAEITPRQLDRGGVGPSGDQVLVVAEGEAQPGGTFAIESEVRIALGDEVRIDGLGLKTRLAGAITAYDDPARPTRARGELRLDGGRYRAYAQDLQIETGRLIFSGGPVTDPAIDLTAFRKPREDIKVGLRARGTLEAPEFSLFSEPAMSQEEQLSWLVLGRSLSATLDSNQRTQLSGAALSLGLTGGDYLAQQLAPRLRVDEVSIGARPGETADLARFTIGKYLSPRLFVSYGVGLFQPGHFFRMQYDIGKRFKLVGESGVQQGGDVLYTIER